MSAVEQASGSGEGGAVGRLSRARSFVTEVRNEMRRVTWPSKREVYATTVVVILVAAFFGFYLSAIDLVLDWVVSVIFRQFGAV